MLQTECANRAGRSTQLSPTLLVSAACLNPQSAYLPPRHERLTIDDLVVLEVSRVIISSVQRKPSSAR